MQKTRLHGDISLSGAPSAGHFHTFSTSDETAPNRLDYWISSAYRAVEARPLPDAPDAPFYGRVASYRGESAQFVHCASSPVDTWLSPGRIRGMLSDEHVAICLLERGEYRVEQSNGERAVLGEGELFMFDCGQPMSSHWTDSSTCYLRLPRPLVRQALGNDPADLGRVATSLSASQLSPFLCAQLRLLAAQGAALGRDELDHAMRVTVDMALFLIGSHLGDARAASDEARWRSGKRQAAYRFMRENAHRHDLTPEIIAAALHCSRAQLYRLFEGEPLSVKAALREIRLQQSRLRLERAGPDAHIGTIAYECGFTDQAAFGKVFRQRFGMTPGEARLGRPPL
ncbi:helix-turn-helix domain-containing protein [Pandoraea bronchicola]|uniref:AraC family transcriptional regulator n=1 Tax=Pandoraea bronchicola TaxID=2508287 RepID=A0A5E5BLI3_9BURK|nr:helix-turn-helix domain-containing protein [Pandoraea bronchicola]VVE86177.1 AraC family transcriptional regulator [Pandoraea bronchicola]